MTQIQKINFTKDLPHYSYANLPRNKYSVTRLAQRYMMLFIG